jgi:hypothetical protein
MLPGHVEFDRCYRLCQLLRRGRTDGGGDVVGVRAFAGGEPLHDGGEKGVSGPEVVEVEPAGRPVASSTARRVRARMPPSPST